MKTWYLVIDVEKCENCQNCFLACKDEHVGNSWPGYASPQPNLGSRWIEIRTAERGSYPLVDVAYLPAPCMHCDDPPCLRAAAGAIHKRPDGIVLIDPLKAKGQKRLSSACPYGAIEWNEELELPQKCTLCAHLLDEGWTKTRCVQSCPTGALALRHADEAEIGTAVERERLQVYGPEHGTRPRVLYRNLDRFTRCFVGGTVAVRVDGREECAEGARVALLGPSGAVVAEGECDGFGDFKLDGLEEGSGPYSLRISYGDRAEKTVEARLGKSVNVGTICLD